MAALGPLSQGGITMTLFKHPHELTTEEAEHVRTVMAQFGEDAAAALGVDAITSNHEKLEGLCIVSVLLLDAMRRLILSQGKRIAALEGAK